MMIKRMSTEDLSYTDAVKTLESSVGSEKITKEEWQEMDTLRRAISYLPSSVVPERMEKFTELFVKSLLGADDSHPDDR